MSRLSLTALAGGAALVAASVLATNVDTVVLFSPAAFETPESIQFDRLGNAYISMALTGEVRRIAPDGTQSPLAFLPIRPDVQPCGNGLGLPIMGSIALDQKRNVYASVISCNLPDLGVWKVTPQGPGFAARRPARGRWAQRDRLPRGMALCIRHPPRLGLADPF